jgi:hypothetical protein
MIMRGGGARCKELDRNGTNIIRRINGLNSVTPRSKRAIVTVT